MEATDCYGAQASLAATTYGRKPAFTITISLLAFTFTVRPFHVPDHGHLHTVHIRQAATTYGPNLIDVLTGLPENGSMRAAKLARLHPPSAL